MLKNWAILRVRPDADLNWLKTTLPPGCRIIAEHLFEQVPGSRHLCDWLIEGDMLRLCNPAKPRRVWILTGCALDDPTKWVAWLFYGVFEPVTVTWLIPAPPDRKREIDTKTWADCEVQFLKIRNLPDKPRIAWEDAKEILGDRYEGSLNQQLLEPKR